MASCLFTKIWVMLPFLIFHVILNVPPNSQAFAPKQRSGSTYEVHGMEEGCPPFEKTVALSPAAGPAATNMPR